MRTLVPALLLVPLFLAPACRAQPLRRQRCCPRPMARAPRVAPPPAAPTWTEVQPAAAKPDVREVLETKILPQVTWQEKAFDAALAELSEASGIRMMLMPGARKAARPPITVSLTDVSVGTALSMLTHAADLGWKIDGHSVSVIASHEMDPVVVEIHDVRDVMAKTPDGPGNDLVLLGKLRRHVDDEVWDDEQHVMRFASRGTLVIKAPRSVQDAIGERLDVLRTEAAARPMPEPRTHLRYFDVKDLLSDEASVRTLRDALKQLVAEGDTLEMQNGILIVRAPSATLRKIEEDLTRRRRARGDLDEPK